MAKLWQRGIEWLRQRREARQWTHSGRLRRAAENMEPGVLTAEGLLGRDARSLSRRLAEDARAAAELGLDWQQAADTLERWMLLGSAGLGNPITVEGRWLVRVDETRGNFACPWEDGLFRKRAATVVRLDAAGQPSGPTLLFSDLSIHLLREHHFLQGEGSAFRLDPRHLVEVLS